MHGRIIFQGYPGPRGPAGNKGANGQPVCADYFSYHNVPRIQSTLALWTPGLRTPDNTDSN